MYNCFQTIQEVSSLGPFACLSVSVCFTAAMTASQQIDVQRMKAEFRRMREKIRRKGPVEVTGMRGAPPARSFPFPFPGVKPSPPPSFLSSSSSVSSSSASPLHQSSPKAVPGAESPQHFASVPATPPPAADMLSCLKPPPLSLDQGVMGRQVQLHDLPLSAEEEPQPSDELAHAPATQESVDVRSSNTSADKKREHLVHNYKLSLCTRIRR